MSRNSIQEKRTRQCWHDMKQRCYNPRAKQFPNYGARGISVCQRWRDSFEYFLADMGIKPDGLTLERIDNDGDYFPDNCRWATRAEQRQNQRGNVLLTHNGKTQTREVWGRELGIHPATIQWRLNHNWPQDAALSIEKFPGTHIYGKAAMEPPK